MIFVVLVSCIHFYKNTDEPTSVIHTTAEASRWVMGLYFPLLRRFNYRTHFIPIIKKVIYLSTLKHNENKTTTRRRMPHKLWQICKNILVIICILENNNVFEILVFIVISHCCASNHCFRVINISDFYLVK